MVHKALQHLLQQGPSRRVTGMIGSRTTPATKTTTGPRTPGPGKAGNIGRQLRTAAKSRNYRQS